MAGLILKTEEIRINFFSGAIYTNRPAETCYLHATDVELRKKLEIFVTKYQKTETTISFYGEGLKTSFFFDNHKMYIFWMIIFVWILIAVVD